MADPPRDLPPCPTNRDDCRIQSLGGMSTCMAWTPTYDREGKLLNQDPNIHEQSWRCTVCGADFRCRTQHGERRWETTGGLAAYWASLEG